MKKILITGCAGLLGVNFTKYLLDKNYEVVGIDNFFGGYKDFLPQHENFHFYEIELSESEKVKNVFNEHNFDCVFHFAAYAAEGLSPFIRIFNYNNNVIASMSIINECILRDIKIVFTSSMAVYGNQQPPFTESMTPVPVDSYGIAKYSVEQDLVSACDQFNLKYNIIRPHNVLGIYQNIWDKYRNVIGIFIRKALKNENLSIYGDGSQTRAFSDIKYYMLPFEKLIDGFDNQTYNIGADKYYTIKEVAEKVIIIAEKYGYKSGIEYLEPRHEVKHAHCDHTKARTELDFIDDTTLDELIETMFVWAMNQPNRDVKKIDYEIGGDKIYSYWR
jgi:UDP-glucose 4-epimerase